MDSHDRTLLAAQGYAELGMYADGLAELKSLPAEVKREPAVIEMRLMIHMQAHEWEKALAQAERICRQCPEAPAGFIHKAFCLHELGRTAEARDTLMGGPQELRHESTYYYNLACYTCRLGDLDAAETYLATSISMDAKFKAVARQDADLAALFARKK